MASPPIGAQETVIASPPPAVYSTMALAPQQSRLRAGFDKGRAVEPQLIKTQALQPASNAASSKIPDADSRDQYRLRVQNDLHQKEMKLARQEAELSAWQEKIQQTHQALLAATSSRTDAQTGGNGAENADAQRSPAQLSKDLEAQTYYAMIVREAVLASRRDINKLRGILAQLAQPR